MAIWQRLFKSKTERARTALLKRLAKGVPELGGEKLAKLVDLVSGENFYIFLEYLELTISENLVTLSNMDVLDERMRIQAAKLQNQMRGVLLVRDLVESLITNSKVLAQEAREKEERNN